MVIIPVILSIATASQSEAVTKSKDPTQACATRGSASDSDHIPVIFCSHALKRVQRFRKTDLGPLTTDY